ncbi:MAG: hypothetical protein U0Y68_18490 [Blastocatellia bacterium]
MAVFSGKFSGGMRVDLEALSRSNNRNAASLEEALQQIEELQYLVANLQTTTAEAQAQALRAGIDNLLRASDFDHSELSWNGGSSSADDLAFWRRGLDDAQRITPSATSPKWDKTNGWLELASVNAADDLSYNFTSRVFRPGVTVFFQCYARLRNQENTPALSLEAGIWDKTTGIDKYLQGALSGQSSDTPEVSKIGPGAATITYGYKVVAIGSDNSVTVSAEGTISGAGTINTTDYNQIRWSSVAGTVEYRVYRTTGGTLGRLASIRSGATSYNDQGAIQVAGEAVPAASPQVAKVTFAPTLLTLTTEWQLRRAEIHVPSGYNFSDTSASGQWLRLGLRGTLPAGNAVFLDRVGLSFGLGTWQPAAEDRTKPVADTVIAPVGWNGLPSYTQGYYDGSTPYDPNNSPVYY